MSDTWHIVVVLLAAGLVIEAVLLVAVMHQLGELLLHGTPGTPGTAAVTGGPRVGTLAAIPGREQAARPALVVFTSSECEQCRALVPGLRQIHALYGPAADNGHQLDLVAVLTDRDLDRRTEHARELGSFARPDLIALMQDWNVPGTPFAVALDAKQHVKGAEVASNQVQLEMLAVEKLGVLFIPAEERPEAADVALDVHLAGGDRSHTQEVVR